MAASTTTHTPPRPRRSSLSPRRIQRRNHNHHIGSANPTRSSSSSSSLTLMDEMIEIQRQRRQASIRQERCGNCDDCLKGHSCLVSADLDSTDELPGAFAVQTRNSHPNTRGGTTTRRRSSISNAPSTASNSSCLFSTTGGSSRRNLMADASQARRRSSMSQLLGMQQHNERPQLTVRESTQSFSTNSSEFMAVAVPAVLVVDDDKDNNAKEQQENQLRQQQAALEQQEEAQLRAWEQELEQQRLSLSREEQQADDNNDNPQNDDDGSRTRRSPTPRRRHTMHTSSVTGALDDPLSNGSDDGHNSIDISAVSSSHLIVAAVPEETYEQQELGPGPMRFAPQKNYRRSSNAKIIGLDENMLESLQQLEHRWSKRYKKFLHQQHLYANMQNHSPTRRPSVISTTTPANTPPHPKQQSISASKQPTPVPQLSTQWHMRFLWFYAQPQKPTHASDDPYHHHHHGANLPTRYTFPLEKIWKAQKKLKPRFVNLNVKTLGPQLYSKTLFPVPGLKTRGGHDMFYMRPSRYFPTCTPTRTIIDNLVYVMNTMLENSHFAQKEGIGFVACMDGWTMKNFEVNYCYQFMMALQGVMVPVKTQLFLIVNPPSWFGAIWKIMKPMLAPSFRKRVKICPEFKIAKYLAPEYEEFLPDDMKSGKAKTDQMVVDFISYRQYVEQGQVNHCIDTNQYYNNPNVNNSHHGGGADYNYNNNINSHNSQSQSTGSSCGGDDDHENSSSYEELSSVHSRNSGLTGSHSTGMGMGMMDSLTNMDDYRHYDVNDDDDDASIHCDIDGEAVEQEEGDSKKPRSRSLSRGRSKRGLFRGILSRGGSK